MLPVVLQRAKDLGHRVFDGDADYDLNIVGIRSADKTPNVFNDTMTVSYRLKGQWYTRSWAITTDPGIYWLNNPMRVAGTAILCPGQYRGAYKLGKHRGRYSALVQRGDMRIYRDADRDNELDLVDTSIVEGKFGINIHRASASRTSTRVDKWSAGCQVFANGPKDFAQFLSLCKKQVKHHPTWTKFTYTLLEAW